MGIKSIDLVPIEAPEGLSSLPEGQKALDGLWCHLTARQREFLVARSQSATDTEASQKLGLKSVSPASDWKNDNPYFAAAYTVLMSSPLAYAQNMVRSIAPKAVHVLERAMEPEQDMKHQLRAAEVTLKTNGMLQPQVQETVHKSLSYEEKLFRFRLEKGLDVPEVLMRRLNGEEGETR